MRFSSLELGVVAVLVLVVCVLAADMTKYYKRTGAKYLEEKAKEEGVVKLPSGMLFKVLTEGKNSKKSNSPNVGDPCKVTYSGKLKDGTPFDSGTTTFAPNQVIKGWTEALQLMCEGDKWELHIPCDMAYGERGSPPKIPPYNPLVFDVELHKVNSGGKSCEEAKKELEKKIQDAAEL